MQAVKKDFLSLSLQKLHNPVTKLQKFVGQRIYFARLEPTFRNQLGLGRGKSGKARFLSTKYQGALKKGDQGQRSGSSPYG